MCSLLILAGTNYTPARFGAAPLPGQIDRGSPTRDHHPLIELVSAAPLTSVQETYLTGDGHLPSNTTVSRYGACKLQHITGSQSVEYLAGLSATLAVPSSIFVRPSSVSSSFSIADPVFSSFLFGTEPRLPGPADEKDPPTEYEAFLSHRMY